VKRFASLVRWDATLQSRNGFYWATAFVVLLVGGLLAALPDAARSDERTWVPAILAVNMQITTFFFMAGLMLLDRDEGVLGALAASPLTPAAYLASRTLTLGALAAIETGAIVWIGFGWVAPWPPLLAGVTALAVIYTGFGAAVGAHYRSVNTLLLPASVLVTALLLPLLFHFGLVPRALVVGHPLDPPLALMRAGYGEVRRAELLYGVFGSAAWGALAFSWGRSRVARLLAESGAGVA
jgi:fluoroquinolone transport system permease protein